MLPSADKELSQYVQAYRQGTEAPPELIESSLEELMRVAAAQDGAQPDDGNGGPDPSSATGATGTKVGALLIGGGTVAVLAIAAAVTLGGGEATAPASSTGVAAIAVEEPELPPTRPQLSAPTSLPSLAEPPEPPSQGVSNAAVPPTVKPKKAATAKKASRPKSELPPAEDMMMAELLLLEKLRSAQRAKKPGTMLGFIRQHEQQFPNSQFVKEREQIRLTALCLAGKEGEFERRLSRFETRYGNAPTSLANCSKMKPSTVGN